jgi:hypothetical protein
VETIRGEAPDGTSVERNVSAGRHVVWFLTSSCRPCQEVWPRLGPEDIVVTPDPATESRRKIAALARTSNGATVVMSSPSWFAYRPGPAPWRVVIVDGRVDQSGPAGPKDRQS